MAEILRALEKTRKGGSETLVELNDAKKTKVWRPTSSLPQKSAGSAPSLTGETPAGQISGQSSTAKYLPQFTSALQFAMDEAGKHRQASLIGMGLSAAAPGGTLAPGTAGGIVDMIRSSVGPEVSAIFGGATQAVSAQIQAEQQEREFQLKVRGQNIDLLAQLAEDGALIDMPDMALIAMGKTAGLSEGAALAWKARLTAAKKQSDDKYNLELKKLSAEIDETKANTLKLLRPPQRAGDGDELGDLSTDEAELIDLALSNLSDDDASILNSLGTKDVKKRWLINKGRGLKEEESPASLGAADFIVSQGLNFLFGTKTGNQITSPKKKSGKLEVEDIF